MRTLWETIASLRVPNAGLVAAAAWLVLYIVSCLDQAEIIWRRPLRKAALEIQWLVVFGLLYVIVRVFPPLDDRTSSIAGPTTIFGVLLTPIVVRSLRMVPLLTRTMLAAALLLAALVAALDPGLPQP